MSKTPSTGDTPTPMPRFTDQYVVDPLRVAEALLARIEAMADERARFRRSLIHSVEVIEAPGFEISARRID